MNAIDKVNKAREIGRISGLNLINNIFTEFIELHGDRKFGDDLAVVGGIGYLEDMPVTIIAIEKGTTTKDRIVRNFGSPNPEGYRKALRLMKQAEKFNRPVICLIDTAGANCGMGAEERGQAQAIADNLMEMMFLNTNIISIIVGEGGSGGALALAIADRVFMLENSIYSVISPEGCASILWKDTNKVMEAAESLKLTAADLHELNIIDGIISEKGNVSLNIKNKLVNTIKVLKSKPLDLSSRFSKYRTIGGQQ